MAALSVSSLPSRPASHFLQPCSRCPLRTPGHPALSSLFFPPRSRSSLLTLFYKAKQHQVLRGFLSSSARSWAETSPGASPTSTLPSADFGAGRMNLGAHNPKKPHAQDSPIPLLAVKG